MTTGAGATGTADLFSETGFAPAFAAFLRHNRDWRRRRIDRLMPIDRDLASRTISLQGVIDADLLKRFLTGRGSDLGLSGLQVRDGEKLTAWIPAISQGKRLLLDFSIRDGQGHSVSMLSRMEAAKAVGQDLLGTLVGGIARKDEPKLAKAIAIMAGGIGQHDRAKLLETRRGAFRSIYILLVTLAFHYPFALRQRIDEWTGQNGSFGESDTSLKDWIRAEGDSFQQGLGDYIVSALRPLLDLRDHIELPPRLGVESGKRFASIPDLVLHAVRDLLEVVASLAQAPDRQLRANLSDPKLLASEAGDRTVDGVRLLEKMLELQRDRDERATSLAREAVMNALERWTAYLVMDIRLGVPFQVKVSETLLLDAPTTLRMRLRPRAAQRNGRRASTGCRQQAIVVPTSAEGAHRRRP